MIFAPSGGIGVPTFISVPGVGLVHERTIFQASASHYRRLLECGVGLQGSSDMLRAKDRPNVQTAYSDSGRRLLDCGSDVDHLLHLDKRYSFLLSD
jgi:hypothetical protein